MMQGTNLLHLLKYQPHKRKSKFRHHQPSKREKLSCQVKVLRYKPMSRHQRRILYHLFYGPLHACVRSAMEVDAIAKGLLKKAQRGPRLKRQRRKQR
jgi:hypothetical protein